MPTDRLQNSVGSGSGINLSSIKKESGPATHNAIKQLTQMVEGAVYPDGSIKKNIKEHVSVETPTGPVKLRDMSKSAVVINFSRMARHNAIGGPAHSASPTPNWTTTFGLALDASLKEGIEGTIAIPKAWQGHEVQVYWTWMHIDLAATGNQRLEFSAFPRAVDEGDTAGPASDLAKTVTVAATAGDNEDTFQETNMGTFSVGANDVILMFQAVRNGAHAGDTYTTDTYHYDLLLQTA